MFQNFNLQKNHYIYLIGGGGKTTLMFALAKYLVGQGHKVITTTSTKIRGSEIGDGGPGLVFRDAKGLDAVMGEIKEGIDKHNHVFVADHEIKESGKLQGLSEVELDAFFEAKVSDYIIVEADGSKGRGLKAHADHEPVISQKADLVVVVVGGDVLGKPISEATVHRSKLFCERLDKQPGDIITEQDVFNIIFHPQGYLKGVGAETEVVTVTSCTRHMWVRRKASHA